MKGRIGMAELNKSEVKHYLDAIAQGVFQKPLYQLSVSEKKTLELILLEKLSAKKFTVEKYDQLKKGINVKSGEKDDTDRKK